jgi:ribonuclease HI
MTLTVHIDGAARGNPGPAAYAYVIRRDGEPDVEAKGCLGSATNNVAEYTALVRALDHAARLGRDRVLVLSDSELLVKQMTGAYRVKSDDLRPLYEEAKRLGERFDALSFRHVPREQNARADRLCNEALDGAASRPVRAGASKTAPTTRPDAREGAVREEVLECLRAAAASWARNDRNAPSAENVWAQLWSVLEEHGVVRARPPR